jgi:hypothetical protein
MLHSEAKDDRGSIGISGHFEGIIISREIEPFRSEKSVAPCVHGNHAQKV